MQARTFPVKVRVKNEFTDDGPLVKSGMYARVMLPTGAKQMATLVSKDALVLGGQHGSYLFVDLARGRTRSRARCGPCPCSSAWPTAA